MTVQKIIPDMASVALVMENIRALKKEKLKTKDLAELGVKNIVGVKLIREISKNV